tara:strand:+ start:257 stop:913 length:657 start_codon:yes stop_codon:yes gene_type:complete
MIEEIIKTDVSPLFINESGINSLSIMDQQKVHQLPVIDLQKNFLGIVNDEIIMELEDLNDPLFVLKNKFIFKFIFKDSHMFEAMKIISQNHLANLPVVDKNYNYIGLISIVDVLNGFNIYDDFMSNKFIIVISSTPKNYILSEIYRIIEDNNGIVNKFWRVIKNDKVELNLIIDSERKERIIRALERYNYKISACFFENDNKDNFDDNFESLYKYLNP